MSVIDKTTYTLVCTDCGTTEKASILDKGSPYSGSAWRPSAHFSDFETSWEGGVPTEPELLSVKCKKCGSTNIKVTSEYSL